MRGYDKNILCEVETQAEAGGCLPAEEFMDYAIFATTEDRDPQMYFPYVFRIFLSESIFLGQIEHRLFYYSFVPIRRPFAHTIDNIVFYQPPLALVSQPPRFPGTATASHLPLGPITSLPVHQIATHMSTKLQGAHISNQNSRNDTQGTCYNLP